MTASLTSSLSSSLTTSTAEVSSVALDDDGRRVLRFNLPGELVADLQSLRGGPVRGIKKWTLPQACWHLSSIIEQNLKHADTTERTPEQEAKKTKFFGMILSDQGMPENLPVPANLDPPADCGPEQIDRLIAAFGLLDQFSHSHIIVGGCGPVAVDEVRQIHLAHAAHHLSFLKQAKRRQNLMYADFDAVIADIRLLERGYVATGKWSLPQICWHLNGATTYFISPGPHAALPTPPGGPERLEELLKSGQIPDGIDAPQHMVPPSDCADEEAEKYIATLNRAKTFAGPFPPHRLFGPLNLEQGRTLMLLHAARHLSFLVPTTRAIAVQ